MNRWDIRSILCEPEVARNEASAKRVIDVLCRQVATAVLIDPDRSLRP